MYSNPPLGEQVTCLNTHFAGFNILAVRIVPHVPRTTPTKRVSKITKRHYAESCYAHFVHQYRSRPTDVLDTAMISRRTRADVS